MSEPGDENKRPRRLTFVIPDQAYWDYRHEADRLNLSITNYFLSLWAAGGIGKKCLCDWTYLVADNNGKKLVLLVDLMTGRLSLTADILYVLLDLCDKIDADDQTAFVYRQTDGRYTEVVIDENGVVEFIDLGDVSFEEITRIFFQKTELPADPMAQSDPS